MAPATETRTKRLPCGLREREYQIALLVMKGHSNKEIAYRLGTKAGTVRNQIATAFEITGARDRTQLALMVWWEIEGKGKTKGKEKQEE